MNLAVAPRPSPRRPLTALIVAFALALGACIAPTLPVPPPSQPDVTAPDSQGLVTVRGGRDAATPGALVTVFNSSDPCTGTCGDSVRGDFADAIGAYEIKIPGKVGDRLLVWQTVGKDTSNSVEAIVR